MYVISLSLRRVATLLQAYSLKTPQFLRKVCFGSTGQLRAKTPMPMRNPPIPTQSHGLLRSTHTTVFD